MSMDSGGGGAVEWAALEKGLEIPEAQKNQLY